MITEIGIAAGDIWNYLDRKGVATLDQLAKETGKPQELLLMSLGWLAREGHIQLEQDGKTFLAKLKDKQEIS